MSWLVARGVGGFTANFELDTSVAIFNRLPEGRWPDYEVEEGGGGRMPADSLVFAL